MVQIEVFFSAACAQTLGEDSVDLSELTSSFTDDATFFLDRKTLGTSILNFVEQHGSKLTHELHVKLTVCLCVSSSAIRRRGLGSRKTQASFSPDGQAGFDPVSLLPQQIRKKNTSNTHVWWDWWEF